MADEITPASVATDGNFHVWFVPDGVGVNPLSVATLAQSTTKSITYSLTAAGWNHSTAEETVSDERLTLVQVLQRAGRVTDELEVQYVFGDDDDVASAALTAGVKGWIVARYALPNGTAAAAAQKVDVIAIQAGVQRKDAPSANGVFTKTQKLFIVDVVKRDVPLVV